MLQSEVFFLRARKGLLIAKMGTVQAGREQGRIAIGVNTHLYFRRRIYTLNTLIAPSPSAGRLSCIMMEGGGKVVSFAFKGKECSLIAEMGCCLEGCRVEQIESIVSRTTSGL